MKKILPYIILVAFVVIATGCDRNFEQTNTNPNNPETINPELLMVTIIRGTINQMNNDAFSPGNIVAQYSAEIREPATDRYQWTGSFSVWGNGYDNLRNTQNLYDVATAAGLDNYKGIALVLRALIFSRMTDCYGDLPYSEALKGKTETPIYSPKYDRQQDIYKGLLDELKQANSLLSSNGGYIRNDILFNGDFLKWKKLANSLRLRLLLRQSNKVNPAAEMQEMVSNTATYPVFASNDDNAALTYAQAPNISPITTQRSGFFLDRRLSAFLAEKLNGLKDPRLPVFAQPTTSSVSAGEPKYVGVRNGETDQNLSSNIDSKVSPLGIIFYNGLQVPVPSQGLVMTLAELKFILAEAAQRGWITGNPQQYYEEGIRASVEYYKKVSGINISVGADYFTQPAVTYQASNALELIGTQKWIALFFNDLQGWHEWKRTGYPALQPSIVNYNDNKIPVRFLYPTDQQITNNANYKDAISKQGPDNINTKLWWQN